MSADRLLPEVLTLSASALESWQRCPRLYLAAHVLRIPASVLRLALGPAADDLMLSGQRVLPERLQESGFTYQHPEIECALRETLQRRR